MNWADLGFLAACAASRTSHPGGQAYYSVVNGLSFNEVALRLSAIKLARLGLVEQVVEEDHNGEAYYAYLITESGIDVLMKNEQHFQQAKPQKKANGFEEMDDSMPF